MTKGAVLFRTAHKTDPYMQQVWGAYTMQHVQKCVACGSRKIAATIVFIPFDGTEHDVTLFTEEGEAKSAIYGYRLCATHAMEGMSKSGAKRMEQLAVNEAWRVEGEQN